LYNILVIHHKRLAPEQLSGIIVIYNPCSMISKLAEKESAINLRRQGFSYSEILERIPVAKSSLSLWLRSVGLSKKQNQRLTEKKLAAALRGALKKKEDRLLRTRITKEAAEKEIGKLTGREKWLIGTALYWAEGSKEKEWSPGSRTQFINSDPLMVRFFLDWLLKILRIPRDMLIFNIYLHENNKHRVQEVIEYWSKQTSFSNNYFQHIYYKKNRVNTKRKNIGNSYFGILKINVRQSSNLTRKISGWINGITRQ